MGELFIKGQKTPYITNLRAKRKSYWKIGTFSSRASSFSFVSFFVGFGVVSFLLFRAWRRPPPRRAKHARIIRVGRCFAHVFGDVCLCRCFSLLLPPWSPNVKVPRRVLFHAHLSHALSRDLPFGINAATWAGCSISTGRRYGDNVSFVAVWARRF